MESSHDAHGPDEDALSDADLELVEQQVNKRLTLNLLIQGAAAHTFITGHHLVKSELDELCPGIVELYDKLAVSLHLNYYIGDIILLHGYGPRFWRRVHRPDHPFHNHRLLATHGGELFRSAKKFLRDRGRGKGVMSIPVA